MNKSSTAYKLLVLLGDGKFHSGEELGEQLGVTRGAIWKARKQLAKLGIEIYAVTGKGYCIPQGIELLDLKTIKQSLSKDSQTSIDEITTLNIIGSTNDYLLLEGARKPNKNIACFAEYQEKGRGRHGRRWVGSFGTNIYFSLLWHFSKDPAEIMGLSLITALALINSLKQYGILKGLQLKWPNDVLWQGKKLAGILLDMTSQPHVKCSVVIGIGVNIRLPKAFSDEIDQPWVDISQITNSAPQRNRLAGLLLDELVLKIKSFEQEGLAPFLSEWEQYDAMIGKRVLLNTPQKQIQGIMKGISDKGELILLTENNETKAFLSGELSLRLAEG